MLFKDMESVGTKLKRHDNYLWFRCPACEDYHRVVINDPERGWTWNGDGDKPTFTPSLLVQWGKDFQFRCHSFITDGKFQFLGDCTYGMKNLTIGMPDWED